MPTTAQMIDALVAMRHDPGGVPVDHFWQLVERFRADLVNQAFAILGHQDDAEDVAQNALAKAFRLLHTLHDPLKLGVWLRQINRRVAYNHLRACKRSRVRAAEKLPTTAAEPTTPTGTKLAMARRREAVGHVAEAVDGLPEHYREVVVLRYWEQMNQEQIALRLGIPVGTVKSRMARADDLLLQRLRRIWSEES
ncbi:MAG: RNA polymerase sigma factor [Planctomycetota bacterium]|nr:RNA polymerase sigma factor [Planctomycetota bacterium]